MTASFDPTSLKSHDPPPDPFHDLFDDVEDLIKRVADVDSPEIQKMRAKVRVALIAARSAAQDGATHVRKRAADAARATDDYVRGYPWQALGIGTLLGLALGALALRSLSPDRGDSASERSD